MALTSSAAGEGHAPSLGANGRRAIIDIGSNSIRLVVFDGPNRYPSVLFNEKVMAGLGRSLSADGLLDEEAVEKTLRALKRFRLLAQEMGVSKLRTVATAAVREAQDGEAFLSKVRAIGVDAELLSGKKEAEAAGLGVISALPKADGIVGDLGGGSLELIRVRNGQTEASISLPLGVLRIAAVCDQGEGALRAFLHEMLQDQYWLKEGKGLPFYMVGGSWRALARYDMHLKSYPLPIIHQYRLETADAPALAEEAARLDRKKLQALSIISSSRIATLADAAALLSDLVDYIGSSELIVSASGLREGLLFDMLDPEERRIDPLISAARAEGAREGRFSQQGDLLNNWIAPLFADEQPEVGRIRHASCLLADIAWRANPEYRADRALEISLHGSWVGVDAYGRAMMGQALATSFGAGSTPLPQLVQLAPPERLRQAAQWGLAMRLGQRFSGGVAPPLNGSALSIDHNEICLLIDKAHSDLFGEAVMRRLRQLGNAMEREHRMEVRMLP